MILLLLSVKIQVLIHKAAVEFVQRVKEYSDNENYEAFVEYAKEWITNKIESLNTELEALNA